MVEARGRLPDLPALVRGRQRRRDRRPAGDRGAPRLPRAARRRRDLAVADLPLAAGGQRLRHLRLPGRRAGVRHARRLRPPARGDPRARDEARDGPRGQPHVGAAPVVRRVPLEPRQPEARLVRLARQAQRLALVLLRPDLGARRGHRPVLPAPVRDLDAGPQLGERGGPRGGLLDDALVARPRGRRLPHGRHQHALQGPRQARGRVDRRSAHPRVPAGDAPRGVRGPRRETADRRRDARRHARAGEALHRPRAARARHGLPVRARRARPGRAEVGRQGPAPHRPQALVRPLADRARRDRLELALLEQPRPAADRLALRRRLPGAPGARREDARHDPAPAPRDAVRLPGRGARDDEHALRLDRRVPRHRVAQPLRRGDRRGRGSRDDAGRAAEDEPRQRAHADAVGRGRARRLHQRRAVDPGQRRTSRRSTPRRRSTIRTRSSTTTGG